jgi:hypothetical protein
MSNDATKDMKFLGLCWAQWATILRETIKSAGVIFVTTNVLTSDQSAALQQALTLLGGGAMIAVPMIYQILQNSISNRIKEVSELPNVKGVVTDTKTATVDLADAPKVVDHPDQIKGA